jgi:hypothetical protein
MRATDDGCAGPQSQSYDKFADSGSLAAGVYGVNREFYRFRQFSGMRQIGRISEPRRSEAVGFSARRLHPYVVLI